jgi:hypothetical protein
LYLALALSIISLSWRRLAAAFDGQMLELAAPIS